MCKKVCNEKDETLHRTLGRTTNIGILVLIKL